MREALSKTTASENETDLKKPWISVRSRCQTW
jgi:hypothetical protein